MTAAADAVRPRLPERLLLAYARRFPIRRGKLRVVNALWRAAAGADRQRLANLRCSDFRMSCDLEEMLQRQFYFFGTYFLEKELLDAWAAAARRARIIFDVGANSGIYALEALAANPGASVHAFEPTPEIAARLRQSVGLNRLDGRLHVHQTAVSDQDGGAVLRRFRGETGDNEGMNYLVDEPSAPDDEVVETVRLDRFCAERGIGRIDLLKLDIQGREPEALEGAGRLLAERRIALIFMELNWGPRADCPADRSIHRLGEAGYRFSAPGPNLEFRAPGDWLRRCSDVLACAPDLEGVGA